MSHAGLTKWVVALCAVAFPVVGCCKKQEQQIEILYGEKQELLTQNKGLRDQLSKAKTHEAGLLTSLDAKDAALTKLKDDLKEAKEGASKKDVAKGATGEGWERTAFGDRVTLGSDILFAAGRATLSRAGKAALKKIARDLKSTYSALPVRVYGYTDGDPIRKSRRLWKDNLDLSANRAMAVTRYLRSMGVSSKRIETIAMGQTNPVAGNTTRAGKAKNRRVEIIVIKK